MKENPIKAQVSATKANGLHNDFSEQEEVMTASAMPPKFALTASAAGEDGSAASADHQISADYLPTAFKSVGLDPADYTHLTPEVANQVIAISVKFLDHEWAALWTAICKHGLEPQLQAIYTAFYERMDWVLDREATSLAILPQMPYHTVAGKKVGQVELVRTADRVGMRAIVPFQGFGGNLILDPKDTSTVLGRSVEAVTPEEFGEQMNQPRGTNYFRFQQEFMVGKNAGGGNVLDVADKAWTWALNNAWLQASVDRGDKIRFISDPTKASTLYRGGGTIKDGLTVTGMELGVLLHREMAPDIGSGEVKKGYIPEEEELQFEWQKIAEKVEIEGKLEDLDQDAYSIFMNQAQSPMRTLKQYFSPEGDLVATQSNYFGGIPGHAVA